MPLQSHCPCASIRQKGRPESACLDARSSLSELGCSRSAPPWERTKLQVPLQLVGAALVPGHWPLGGRAEGGGAVEILLWGEDRHLFWGLPGSLVLCLSQPRGFPPSHHRVQGPEPRGRRHRGDHLSPPRPGLCDECAGHLEEVGDWSQPGCPLAGCVPALRCLYLYLHLHTCGFAPWEHTAM